jgi:hypothetical protein
MADEGAHAADHKAVTPLPWLLYLQLLQPTAQPLEEIFERQVYRHHAYELTLPA